jgi:hypothetical protein
VSSPFPSSFAGRSFLFIHLRSIFAFSTPFIHDKMKFAILAAALVSTSSVSAFTINFVNNCQQSASPSLPSSDYT